MAKEWADMTPAERRAQRFERWLSPEGITFNSPEAEKKYSARVTRFARVLQLQEPDRVPCMLAASLYAAQYAGTNLHTVMYDYGELKRAWLKLLDDFESDTFMAPVLVPSGPALEAVDYKLYKWPGHGISENTISYQAVEDEWMLPDEYDALINDPSNFWLRTYLPRIFGALKGFTQLPVMTSFQEIDAAVSLLPFGLPDVQAGLQALMEAGRETLQWIGAVGEVAQAATMAGYPGIMSGLAKAPFDTLGDTLRGTQGIMKDMFQRPDKLKAAMERLVPLTVERALSAANAATAPTVFMPLHKGADSFMSVKQYEQFYWPTFRQVIMALVEEGLVPVLFAEGSYNNRLDIIKDLPRGAVAWYFDQTDMKRAKEVLGDISCIWGNVPTSLIMTGTPAEVKEHCRRLIETCGKGGGYVLAAGANVDEGNPDNLRAMMEAALEYGVY